MFSKHLIKQGHSNIKNGSADYETTAQTVHYPT